MTSSTNVPGMIYPTQKGMVGTTPADSARMTTLNKSQSQANANRLMAGGIRKNRRAKSSRRKPKSRKPKSRKHKLFKGGVITVPTYQMLYEPQGGPGTDPNSQIQRNSFNSVQMHQNATFDNHAIIKGGRRPPNHLV